jgi:Synergist-CTERM protein sorting domain-containing protein
MATAALAFASPVTVAAGASQTFTALAAAGPGTPGTSHQQFGGAITAAGVYTAGTTGGVADMVRVTDSASHTATATVTVTARSIPSDSNSGCSATGARFPQLAFLVLPLLVSRRRRV